MIDISMVKNELEDKVKEIIFVFIDDAASSAPYFSVVINQNDKIKDIINSMIFSMKKSLEHL